MASVSAREKVKCSRNKRKFRQDPPCQSQGSGEDSPTAGFSATSDESGVDWEPRSAEAIGKNSSGADSVSKEGELGTSCETSHTSKVYQEHVKLMKWFTNRKGSLAGDTDGKIEDDGEVMKDNESCEDEDDFDDLDEAEWDDCTEGELEELLLKGLEAFYKEALVKIQSKGYNAEEALKAVLRQGRCYGGKDAVSNIVENALVYLSGKKLVNETNMTFGDLNELQRSGLNEMVHLLREVRPKLSRGDAMWCLLMCDMNVRLACVMDDVSASAPTLKEPIPLPAASPEQSKPSSDDHSDSALPKTSKVKLLKVPPSHNPAESPPSNGWACLEPGLKSSSASSPTVDHCPSLPPLPPLPRLKGSPPSSSTKRCSVASPDVKTSTSFDVVSSGELSEASGPPPKDPGSWYVKESREQLMERDKVLPTATCNLTSGLDKGVPNVESATSIGDSSSMALKERESSADSCSGAKQSHHQSEKSSSKLESKDGKVAGESLTSSNKSPLESRILALSSSADALGHHKPPDAPVKLQDSESGAKDGAEVKLADISTTSVVAEDSSSSSGKLGTVEEQAATKCAASQVSGDSSSVAKSSSLTDTTKSTMETKVVNQPLKEVSEDSPPAKEKDALKGEIDEQKDEMIMKLIQRARELETQLQDRTEWAKQKVMQAARRLTKDLQELKALRLEKEEANRLKKEKQVSEESATKKQTDLETALRKASSQADRANANLRKLEGENAELRAELQAAKLSAAESTASCQELEKRERKSVKRTQAWEKQKVKLQEELTDERRKYALLQQQNLLAKERQKQAEVRWRQEEKAREEAADRADYERRAREQADAAAKRREESLRRKAELNYQRHKEDLQRLECEVAQLRTTAEAAQFATSRWGPGVAVTPHMMELSNMQSLKDTNLRLHRELLELREMSEGLARREVRRDRECVMCMCEEMSVVFLPCAHQVVCVKCNDLHEKQGMRDCPSCRTLIQQRIRVFGVTSS